MQAGQCPLTCPDRASWWEAEGVVSLNPVVMGSSRPLGRPERGDSQCLETCSNTGFDGRYAYGQCFVAPASFAGGFEKERVYGWVVSDLVGAAFQVDRKEGSK